MGDDETPREVQPVPWPDHPRPDLHRGLREGRDWVNLNGAWEFEFDPEDVGEREGWFQTRASGQGRELAEQIVVPFPWESRAAWGRAELAGNDDWFDPHAFREPEQVTVENYRDALRHEIGWYRRTFRLPARWAADRVFLRFGAVDWEAKVWVDGRPAGRFESGYLPFEVDITDLLDGKPEADHEVVVRAYDPNAHGEQPVGKQHRWYARTAGIWQTVWLEPRGSVFVQGVRFLPSLRLGQVTCELLVAASPGASAGGGRPSRPDLGVRLTIQYPGGGSIVHTAPAPEALEQGLYCTDVTLDRVEPWSPESPALYQCLIELLDGSGVADMVHTYFGMRDVHAAPLPGRDWQYVWLNGQPIYLRGVLDQSFHPAGIYTFPSDEAVARDLRAARDLGYNLVRLHIKAEAPRWHYWADRLGLLVMADLPNFGYDSYSPRACRLYERTMSRIVERDFNHPAIIAWCLFNESWGLGNDEFKALPERQEWVEAMYGAAKALDPTRLIEDNSPCFYDHVRTDLNSWHFYLNDPAEARAHIESVVQQTHEGSGFNFVPGRHAGNEPLLNSEYGGIGAGMGDRDISWCLRFLTNQLRRHERICGYVYTELTDVEWERNGLLNYDRTPKELGYRPTWVNSADFLCLDAPPALAVPPGGAVQIPALVSHFGQSLGDWANLRWRLEHTDHLGVERGIVSQGKRRVAFPRFGVTPVGSVTTTAPPWPGLAVLHAWLEDRSGNTLARNWVHLVVAEEADGGPQRSPRCEQVVLDQDQPATVLRAGPQEMTGGLLGGQGELRIAPPGAWVEARWRLGEALGEHADRDLEGLHIILEASSHRPGTLGGPEAEVPGQPVPCKQTDAEKWPSELRLWLNGRLVHEQPLADHPADGRGALSHYAGLGGQYGELLRVEVDPREVAELSAGQPAELVLRLQTPAEGGGLTIYGERAGRYPVDVCVVLLHD